ncbi:hypothetical protein EX30DRAFT_307020 [Ascodesmis nigricans]|uniref:Spindle pole body component n=1 Tax=Ascodesmis nigricans TaxID=341454 RepID=A0A4S2MW81_9PEZI|nr:hypothetical protein EX30DRAFT_307020 [Ascodesmis nigricans]
MLHELFLLLSGNPSSLITLDGLPANFPLVSPSERAILKTLGTLGHLHISLRNACQSITTSHSSAIARAVASGIETDNLQTFRDRILTVEESVIRKDDTGIVVAYDAPLAKVLNSFDGWDRMLNYLHDLVEFMAPGSGTIQRLAKTGNPASGAEIINRLRGDIYTGYPQLEEAALGLLRIAEMAWLRDVSTWVLYGRLPVAADYGSSRPSADFFIMEVDGPEIQMEDSMVDVDAARMKEYQINKSLLPSFVTSSTASSLLFIGRALSKIRMSGGASGDHAFSSAAVASPEMTLLPIHLGYLQSLQSPLSPQKLSKATSDIRLSLSKHTLQNLLPAEHILDSINLLRDFFLLGRGEFALSLVEEASEPARQRAKTPSSRKPSLRGAVIKENEVTGMLTRTWAVLSSLQGEEAHDDLLDSARDLLFLTLQKNKSGASSVNATPTAPGPHRIAADYHDVLIGVPVSLCFTLSWPLELFLQPSDLEEYDALFAYLISVRKAQMRLQSLWRGRRDTVTFHDKEDIKRLRERHRQDRVIWATASMAHFFLETLMDFWQGEVISSAFKTLVNIVSPPVAERDNTPEDMSMSMIDDDDEDLSTDEEDDNDDEDIWMQLETEEAVKKTGTLSTTMEAQQQEAAQTQQDPESLMRAHHAYLNNIKRNTFLADTHFATQLKRFLATVEMLAAGVEDIVRNHELEDLGVEGMEVADEERQRKVLEERCEDVKDMLRLLVRRLEKIDEERERWSGEGLDLLAAAGKKKVGRREGVKVERLLMRMDLGSLAL